MTTRETAVATLAGFDHAWAELDEAVKALGEQALTEARDAAGWAAKDHLMHIAAWERALLAKLDGRPRHQALGIDAAADASGDDERINGAIFASTRARPLRDVLAALRDTHAATRARLVALVGSVAGPPSALDGEAAKTLLAEVPSYTEHYEQHHGWIRELVARAKP